MYCTLCIPCPDVAILSSLRTQKAVTCCYAESALPSPAVPDNLSNRNLAAAPFNNFKIEPRLVGSANEGLSRARAARINSLYLVLVSLTVASDLSRWAQ